MYCVGKFFRLDIVDGGIGQSASRLINGNYIIRSFGVYKIIELRRTIRHIVSGVIIIREISRGASDKGIISEILNAADERAHINIVLYN